MIHNYPQLSRSAWNQWLRHFQVLKFTSWADPYFVVLLLNANTSRSRSRLGLATSRSRSRLESRTSRLGLVSDKMPNVSVSSRSRTHASRVSSRSRPERSRAHPCKTSPGLMCPKMLHTGGYPPTTMAPLPLTIKAHSPLSSSSFPTLPFFLPLNWCLEAAP